MTRLRLVSATYWKLCHPCGGEISGRTLCAWAKGAGYICLRCHRRDLHRALALASIAPPTDQPGMLLGSLGFSRAEAS